MTTIRAIAVPGGTQTIVDLSEYARLDEVPGLDDLADTGIGAALVKITRDVKGRVQGTQAANTGDLAEGSNLYYTDGRADTRAAAVQFDAGLTGQVARTVLNRLEDWVSVKDFGAVGDGVTDDSTAIQAAIDASLIVYFPDGDYRIAGTITVRDFQVLYGSASYGQGGTAQAQGGARLVFDGTATACISQQDTATALLHFSMAYLTVRATGTYSWMVDFKTIAGLKFQQVRLETTVTTIGGMRTTKINPGDSSWVGHFMDTNIRLPTGGSARTIDTDMSDCSWIGGTLGGGTGAILRGTGGWKLCGTRVDNATGYGVTISVETESLSQHNLVGCQIEQNTVGGLLIDGDADDTLTETDVNFVVSGCQFRNPGGTDIVFQNATGPVLTGGTITGCMFTAPSTTRISRDQTRWKHVTVSGNTHNGATVAENNHVGSQFIASTLVLAKSAVAVPHTGDTNDTTLVTIAVPANAMGINGRLRITTLWSYTNNANNKNLRVKFNGTNYTSIPATTTATSRLVTEIANRNAANSQVGAAANYIGIGASAGALVTSAHDTTAAQNLTITTQLANAADTVTLESYVVELIRGE